LEQKFVDRVTNCSLATLAYDVDTCSLTRPMQLPLSRPTFY